MRKATIARFACVSFLLFPFVPLAPVLAGPNFPAVYDRIAEVKSKAAEGQYLGAAEELEQVAVTWPEERYGVSWALYWAATMYQKVGDINRALETFERLLDEYPEQLDAGATARWALANDCYLPLGQYDKGLALLLEMVMCSNDYEGCGVPGCGRVFLPWARQQVVEYLGKAASAYAEQGRPGEFAHLIRGALADSWSGAAWEIVADVMLAAGQGLAAPRNVEEEEYYQTVVYNYEHLWLPSVPTPSAERDRALRWLACVKLIYGETDPAKQVLQQVLDGNSGSTEAALAGLMLAQIRKAQHLVRGSFSAYRAALAAVPASAPPPDALVALLDGYGERGEWELAIQGVGPLIDAYCASANACDVIWGDLHHALHTLAQDMMRRGEYAAARALLQAMLEMPLSLQERGTVQSGLAYAYSLEGNYDQAIAVYEAIVSGYPSLPVRRAAALFRLGLVYEAKGDTEHALKAFRRLIAEIPGSPWEDSAQLKIEQLSSH